MKNKIVGIDAYIAPKKHYFKKALSLLLSFIMLLSITAGIEISAYAAGWANNVTNVNLNEEYTMYCNNSNKAYTTLGSYGYYIGLSINIPVNGAITINSESEYKYACPDITIYKSSDLNNSIGKFYASTEYSSAYGVYQSAIATSLGKGNYYILCDIYDCYDYIRDGRVDGSFQISINYKPNISKPSNFKVSTRNVNSLKLSWGKVSGASGYQVQQYKSSKWTTLKNTTSNAYTVSKLSAGTAYQFRVRTYKTISGKKYYSSWVTLTTPTRPSTVTLSSLKSNKSKQFTVKWKKVTGTGYQVQYSTDKNFSKNNKTINVTSKNSTISKTISKLSGKKKYYVRVRAYKTVNGTKYCGAWSKSKAVTTRK